jgi:hypothetical protein
MSRFTEAIENLIEYYELDDYELAWANETRDFEVVYYTPDPASDWETVYQYEIAFKNQSTGMTRTFVFDSYENFINNEEPILIT